MDEFEKNARKKPTQTEITELTSAMPQETEVAVTPPDVNNDIAMPAAPPVPEPSFYHSAHFDSYMTGYVFLHQMQDIRDHSVHANKLYLMGKDIPLPIQKSAFTNLSKGWLELKADLTKLNNGSIE